VVPSPYPSIIPILVTQPKRHIAQNFSSANHGISLQISTQLKSILLGVSQIYLISDLIPLLTLAVWLTLPALDWLVLPEVS
jgi:hypothetical protein